MADIDFGQLSEALNDKMDRDAHNNSVVMPDYSNGSTITSGFVADQNYVGFCCTDYVTNTECWVKVNGVYVYRYLGGLYEKQCGSQWFVPKGATVTFSSTAWSVAPVVYPLVA